MLNGLSEISVKRMAALMAVGAGFVVAAAVATVPAGATTNEAGGCAFAAPVTSGQVHTAALFRPAGCL